MVLQTGSSHFLVGQSDDPQWYIAIYHTEGKQLSPTSWQTNKGIVHALECNGTFSFNSPFLLHQEDVECVFDVLQTNEEAVDTIRVQKQSIDTAPKDGTIIMGYWEGDPDPRPHAVAYYPAYRQWILEGGEEHGEDTIPPTHWSPIQ